MSDPVLQIKGLRQTFTQGDVPLEVLRGADLEVRSGEIVALIGPSGSGKSTLLQIAGLLEKAQKGDVSIRGTAVNNLRDDARTQIRRQDLGFVYQYHHLLSEFSARENIMLPQMIAGVPKAAAQNKADNLLTAMGLSDRATHRPARLSGGEQQRVAMARALANNPRLILADEPTGNLDPATADHVFSLLVDLVKKSGVAALIATHNPDLAAKMDRIVKLENGLLLAT
ncbi:MAG: ABC transporter ATP-binding protein [Rhodospirillales bacterium]|nr:ABC transporter ATP-binding protein [Rhodospirillales bacterium]